MALPKNIVVTGANRGIGLGFVKHFLSSSPLPEHVFATCRSAASSESCKDLAGLAKEHAGRLHIVQMDVCDEASVIKAASDVGSVVGSNGINLLINNAGVFPNMSTLDEVNAEGLMKCFQTNTVGPAITTKAFLAQLRSAAASQDTEIHSWQRAAVVNISSGMGSLGNNTRGGFYAYRASKTALNQVTKTISLELGKDGIITISVCPGWVQTDMGTDRAHLTVQDSVSALVEFFTKMDSSYNGGFFNRFGKPMIY